MSLPQATVFWAIRMCALAAVSLHDLISLRHTFKAGQTEMALCLPDPFAPVGLSRLRLRFR
jgi:hypothetical protein